MGKTRELFKKIRDTKGIFHAKMGTIKNRNGMDLTECLKNYGWRFITLCRRQWKRQSPRRRNANRQNGCLRRPNKWLRKKRC